MDVVDYAIDGQRVQLTEIMSMVRKQRHFRPNETGSRFFFQAIINRRAAKHPMVNFWVLSRES